MALGEHFFQMARNNAWSNVRLYGACRRLDDAALRAKRTSFFPTILSTLQHLWIVDEYYVSGLEGRGHAYALFDDEERHADIESLFHAQRAVDERLIAVCAAARDAGYGGRAVTLERPSGPQVDAMSDVLAHLFVHQIHHRGQVHAMLAGTTEAPPQLDEWFLAADRPIAERELDAVRAASR